jgi:predicted amidohydrolase YtcJ
VTGSWPAADLKDMKCQMTVFDGKIVFQAEQPVAN